MELLTVNEVASICKIKQCRAYKLIKEVNEEMQKKGYIIIRGRVNKDYLYTRLGLEVNNNASK